MISAIYSRGGECPVHGLYKVIKSFSLALPRQLPVGLEIQSTEGLIFDNVVWPANDVIHAQTAFGRRKVPHSRSKRISHLEA